MLALGASGTQAASEHGTLLKSDLTTGATLEIKLYYLLNTESEWVVYRFGLASVCACLGQGAKNPEPILTKQSNNDS